jgi:hypothetical protein
MSVNARFKTDPGSQVCSFPDGDLLFEERGMSVSFTYHKGYVYKMISSTDVSNGIVNVTIANANCRYVLTIRRELRDGSKWIPSELLLYSGVLGKNSGGDAQKQNP